MAVVCGGSRGIGKETARQIIARGGSVCIIGRDSTALAATAAEFNALIDGDSQSIHALVADATDIDSLKPVITAFIDEVGVPDYLINMVGFARPQYVQDLSLEDFRQSMDTNYFGQLIPILVLLPHFMAQGKGHIANVSSMMGFFGIMGYTAYAPSKFAIVGLTEALRNEMKPYNISFSILYPPDTDTPGFEQENRLKPRECMLMSESVKLMSAEAVAGIFVDGISKGKYAIFPGGSGLVWRISRYFPLLLRWITDYKYKAARRIIGRD